MAKLTLEQAQEVADAYFETGGNVAQAAEVLGVARSTFRDRMKAAEREFKFSFKPMTGGTVHQDIPVVLKKPKKGKVKYYLLTSAQNNTEIHPGWNNLLAYYHWLDSLENASCELIVATFSYNKNAYGVKAVKRGSAPTAKDKSKLWYAPEIEPFIRDENIEIAPGLVWGGKQNILPTAKFPLSGKERLNGRKSNIIPHAKQHTLSVASLPNEATKVNYSTGAVTLRNYVQKNAGIEAEADHDYGARLVCVDDKGNWWVRGLKIGAQDEIMDIGPAGYAGVIIQAGIVRESHVTAGIYWADIHESEADDWAMELAFGKGGVLDTLQPHHQVMGDVLSMKYCSKHDWKDFHVRYRRYVDGETSVEQELQECADFLVKAERDFCTTHICSSNHHDHLNQWANHYDFRVDPQNAKLFCWVNYHILDAMDKGDSDFDLFKWTMMERGCPPTVNFLAREQSLVIAGIENSLHGDEGPNGARGSTKNLTKLGRPVNKGHDHNMANYGNVFSAGAMALRFDYQSGPSAHTISHIVTYLNGERTHITFWNDKYRA